MLIAKLYEFNNRFFTRFLVLNLFGVHDLTNQPENKHEPIEYDGFAASPGIAIGHAFIYDEANFWVDEKDISLDEVEKKNVSRMQSRK